MQKTINGWAWFSDHRQHFGIVIITNEVEEQKAYIGNLKGNDNCFEDLQFIVDRGAKFPLEAAEIAIRQKGTWKDILYKELMP